MVQTQLGQSGREPKSMSSTNTEFVGGADYISFAAFVDSECSGFSFELNNELNHILAQFNEKIDIQNALARAMVRVKVQVPKSKSNRPYISLANFHLQVVNVRNH